MWNTGRWYGRLAGNLGSCYQNLHSLVADLHDRMPVIVPQEKYDLWLDPDVTDFEAVRNILKAYDANLMRRYPVSMKLNNSRIDDAECASPVTLDTPTQAKLF